jgi:hypothetical protein
MPLKPCPDCRPPLSGHQTCTHQGCENGKVTVTCHVCNGRGYVEIPKIPHNWYHGCSNCGGLQEGPEASRPVVEKKKLIARIAEDKDISHAKDAMAPVMCLDSSRDGAPARIIQRWHWHVIWPRFGAQDRPGWHSQQHTSSERTPLARMLPRVIGGPG